jgi:hypothetical protein
MLAIGWLAAAGKKRIVQSSEIGEIAKERAEWTP